LVYDINDFDETLAGPWEFDLKRLATSIALEGRTGGLDATAVAEHVWVAVDAYCRSMLSFMDMTTLELHYAHVEADAHVSAIKNSKVRKAAKRYVKKARKRTNTQAMHKWTVRRDGMLQFREDPPTLTRLTPIEVAELHSRYNSYRDSLPADRRHLLEQYRFSDAAHRVVGVGSVGLRSYVIVLEGRGDSDPLFLQVKQAVSSVLTPFMGQSRYATHGERVVSGQRIMQGISDPFLGWEDVDGDFYIRQLRDMKGPSVPESDPVILAAGAVLVSEVLARSHARSVDPGVIAGYVGKGDVFVSAVSRFAASYATQAERDYEQFMSAIAAGTFPSE
jgi:uncharacterized protein (DUF2252 family)